MKKITAIFTAALILFASNVIGFAETEDIIYDTTEQLSKFYQSVSNVSVSDGILTCEVSNAQRSCFRTSCNFTLSDYDEAEMLIKCSNVKSPTSLAVTKDGKRVPVARLSLKVIDKNNTMSNKTLDMYYAEATDSEIYNIDEYVSVETYFSDIEGYDTEKYKVYSITVYPAYGFSQGTVYVDSLKIHKAKTEIKPEVHEQTTEEQWFNCEFDTEKEGWTAIDKRITLTVEDGALKYNSVFNTSNQSGWMYKKVEFDGGQYYRIDMRIKVDGAALTPTGSMPYMRLYYSAKNKDGTSHNSSDSYCCDLSYTCTKADDGLCYSDWVEYSIDLSSLKGWDLAESVSEIRMDVLKNAEGTVYIDYIRLISTPAISKIGYNGGSGQDMQSVPINAKTFEVYLTQPIYSIDESGVKIYDTDGSNVTIDSIKYDKNENKVTIEISNELYSMTDYTIELTKEVKMNKLQNLYSELYAPFKTDASDFEVSVTKAKRKEVTVSAVNSSSEKRTILVLVTLWNGDLYEGKKVVSVDVEAGTTEITTLDISGLSGKNAEVISWEYADGVPKALGNKVYKFER